jgi:GNAT superfamily N-acetyltransferase
VTESPLTALVVGIEPATSVKDAKGVAAVADLINAVYEQAEAGLWVDRASRTSGPEIAELIARGQIATARSGDRVVGAVRVHALDGDAAEFGMLAADPAQRGLGIGRALVAFAEGWAVDQGLSFMQLELLVPTTWDHPSKQFLREWYSRLGYRVVRTGKLEESYPDLAPLLATPCDLVVYRKALSGEVASR